jgi:hypothetical protein
MRVSRNPDTNIRIKVTTTVNKAHEFIYFCEVKIQAGKLMGDISGRVQNYPQFYLIVKDTEVVKH